MSERRKLRLVKSKYKKAVKNKDIRKKIKKALYKVFNDYIPQIIIGNTIVLFVVVIVTTILLVLGFISFDLLRVLWLISVSPMYCLLILKIFFCKYKLRLYKMFLAQTINKRI